MHSPQSSLQHCSQWPGHRQHSCPSTNEWKEDMVHMYSGALLDHGKEQNWVVCRDVNMLPFLKESVMSKQ